VTARGDPINVLRVNTIGMHSVDAVEQTRSGHSGLTLEAAGTGYVHWPRRLRHDRADPAWPDCDRFVPSARLPGATEASSR